MQSYDYINFIIYMCPTCNLIKRQKVILARPSCPHLMQKASHSVCLRPRRAAPSGGALPPITSRSSLLFPRPDQGQR